VAIIGIVLMVVTPCGRRVAVRDETALLRRCLHGLYGRADSLAGSGGTRMTRMTRTVLVGLAAATGCLATLLLALPTQAQAAVNCSDFSTQAAAQNYYESVGGPGQDPAGLDADHDGIACESLPCPCRSLSADTDGDGWVDQFDACPTVAARTANGCPLPPPPPPPMDVTPPNTMITAHPSGSTTSAGALFSFTSTEAGSTFTCTLDGVGAVCTSPKTYSRLAVGSHTFTVAARDTAGNTDPTPASFSWAIGRRVILHVDGQQSRVD
jgi:excalibur calcium-binding domain-containing protein